MNDLLVSLLAFLAQSLGSLGGAIVVLSLGIRVALLPLTVKLARRARRNQEMMSILRPEIERLQKKYAEKPRQLLEEMGKLYRKHDCNPFDIPALLAGFVQLPLFGILYSSIKNSLGPGGSFLWIKSLASPDFLLTLLILSLTGLTAFWMPSASDEARTALIFIQVAVTFFVVWKLAAGLGLYWASSGLVSVVQALWLHYRNDARRKAA